MESFAIIPKHPEGFGSLLQYALAGYFLAQQCGKQYCHIPFSFEHGSQEGKNQEDWNRELNLAITNLFVPNCLLASERVIFINPDKWPLESIVRYKPEKLAELSTFYHNKNKRPTYFDKTKINIAIHARTFNSTDCDPSEFRECFDKGGVSDQFMSAMISQLSNLFSKCHFHVYVKTKSKAEHYTSIPNVYLHCDGSILDDLHHMIEADLLIMSKSSYSVVASYYRKGPCLMRSHYGFATPPNVLFVQNDKLDSDQTNIIAKFSLNALIDRTVIKNKSKTEICN